MAFTLGILGVLLTVYFLFNLQEGRRLNEARMRGALNDITNRIWEAYSLELDMPEIDENLVGYGIYQKGMPLVRYGTAPLRLGPGRRAVPLVEDENHFRFVREVGGPPTRENNGPFHIAPMQQLAVLVDINITPYIRADFTRKIGQYLFLLAIAGLIAAVYLLTRRLILMQKEGESQKRLAQLGEAARTLTHELKNPLGTLKMQQALLKKTLPPEHRDSVRILGEEVDRMNNLINRVSHFLRNPKGTPQTIELIPFVEKLLAKLPYSTELVRGQDIRALIQFDPENLRSVLENLIKNGAESLPEGSPLTLEAEEHKGTLKLKIHDQGPGIPPETIEKVFDPFYTTKFSGSGVGLAIVKSFMEAQGGKIRLINRTPLGLSAELTFRKEKS